MNGSEFGLVCDVVTSLLKPELRMALRAVIQDTGLDDYPISETAAEKESEVVLWLTGAVKKMEDQVDGIVDLTQGDISTVTIQWINQEGWVMRKEPRPLVNTMKEKEEGQ